MFGCGGSSLLLGLFSSCRKQGCGAPASHCSGFPYCGAQALELSLSSGATWILVALRHVGSSRIRD